MGASSPSRRAAPSCDPPYVDERARFGPLRRARETKAYTVEEVRALFSQFSQVDVRVQLSFGDLLEGGVGQRHRGPLLALAKCLWPRALIRRWLSGRGLYLLIDAVK